MGECFQGVCPICVVCKQTYPHSCNTWGNRILSFLLLLTAWRMHIPSILRTYHTHAHIRTPSRLLSFISCSLHARVFLPTHPLPGDDFFFFFNHAQWNKLVVVAKISAAIFFWFPRLSLLKHPFSLPCDPHRHLFQIRIHPGSLPDMESIVAHFTDCFFILFSFYIHQIGNTFSL